MKAFAPRTLPFVGWFPLALFLVGCPSQSEGQRCDLRNVNADCTSGLVCTQVASGVQLCCLPVGQTSSTPACNGLPTEDAAQTPDVSEEEADVTSDVATTDAASEAPADTASEESQAPLPDASNESTTDSATADAADGAAQ